MSRTLRHPRLLVFALVLAASVALAGCSPTPPSCVYSLSHSVVTLPAVGGSDTVTVTTAKGCAWTATPGASWLTVAPPGGGTGGGTVSVSAGANGPAARSTTLVIGSQSLPVTQEAAPAPRYTISGHVADVFFGPRPGLVSVAVAASGSAGSGSALTDLAGDYTISGLLAGTYTVTFEKTYYQKASATVTVAGPVTLPMTMTLEAPAQPSVSNLTGYWTGVGTYPGNPFKLALVHTGNQFRGWYVDSHGDTGTLSEWRIALPEFTILANFGDAGLLLECVLEDARRAKGVQRTPSLGNTPYPFEMAR